MQPLQPGDPASVGPYRLEGRVGAGGMGQVYVGRSPGGRRLAVKVIRTEHVADPDFRRRFAREIDAARRVGGFHTAQIVAADPEAEQPWMATAYIDGPSLLDLVRDVGPLPVERCITLARELAEGLAAIHVCDLIHRDLKPANVLMAADGVRIIDFGIARAAGASSLTSVGVAVGTFAYMSPEQVAAGALDQASDLFSFGAVLTFAATGHGPFDADSIPAIAYRIMTAEPDLGGLQGPLRDIIAACLAKNPEGRPSATEVLALLDAAAETEPDIETVFEAEAPAAEPTFIAANAPIPPQEETQAQPQPQPLAGEPTTAAAIAGVHPAIGSVDQGPKGQLWPARGRRRRRVLIIALASPIAAAAITVPLLLAPDTPHAPTSHTALSLTSASRTPTPRTSSSRPPASRTTTSSASTSASSAGTTLVDPGDGKTDAVAFAPGGTTLALGNTDGDTYLWNTETSRLTATLTDPGDSAGADAVAFAPGGATLAVGDVTGDTYLWNIATGKITTTVDDPGTAASGGYRSVASVAFAPDGKTLATADYNGNTYLWNTETGDLTASLADPTRDDAGIEAGVLSVAFAPDGTTLATGNYDGDTYLWNTRTGELAATLTDPGGGDGDGEISVGSVAFAPDGKTLATSEGDGHIYLWDIATEQITATLNDPDSSCSSNNDFVPSLAFAPDGKTLASGDYNGDIYLWDIATGKTTATLTDPGSGCNGTYNFVPSMAFAPDGTALATGEGGGNAYLWENPGH